MPRTSRASVGDYCYHVINCGTGHTEVFHAEGHYQAFETLLKDASQRPVRLADQTPALNRVPLHRAQSCSCRPGRTGRRLAVLACASLGGTIAWSLYRDRTRGSTRAVAVVD